MSYLTEKIKQFIDETGITLKYFDKPNEKHIFLDDINCEVKPGCGTQAMRYLVQLSDEKGYGGALRLEAGYKAHLFHLYMGLIPLDRSLDYVEFLYGPEMAKALDAVLKCSMETDSKEIMLYKNSLVLLLSKELNVPESEITIQKIIQNREFLSYLKTKKKSYLQDQFIPMLLALLETNLDIKRPDSTHWNDIDMELSKEGKARWLQAIKDNAPFVLFRSFEQLRPYMSKEQINMLDDILIKRECALKMKEKIVDQFALKTISNSLITLVQPLEVSSDTQDCKEKTLEVIKDKGNVKYLNQEIPKYSDSKVILFANSAKKMNDRVKLESNLSTESDSYQNEEKMVDNTDCANFQK